MTATQFMNALGKIDGRYVFEAMSYRPKKRKIWLKYVAAAACFIVIVAALSGLPFAFIGSNMTDVYRVGDCIPNVDITELDGIFDGELLTAKLDFSGATEVSKGLYYTGDPNDPEDWYSLIIGARYENTDMTVFCIFGDEDIEDWRVSMVLSEKNTQEYTIGGTEVLVAQNLHSGRFNGGYWYYAIFKQDGVIYDVRVDSQEDLAIFGVLREMLE